MEGMIVESRTQTPEQIAKILEDDGFEVVMTTTVSDEPASDPPAEEAGNEEGEKPKTPEAEPAKDKDAEGEPAGEKPDEGKPAVEPVVAKPAEEPKDEDAERKRVPGSRRIKQQRDEAIARLARVEKERDELAAKLATPQPPTAAIPAAVAPTPAAPKPVVVEDEEDKPKPEPKYEDFADSDEQLLAWTKASIRWEADERDRARRVAEKTAARQKVETETAATQAEAQKAYEGFWKEQTTAAKVKYDDFDAVLANPKVTVSEVMKCCVQGSDRAAEILYWLGKHPEEANKLTAETQLPKNFTLIDVNRLQRKVYRFYEEIEKQLEAEDAADDDSEPVTPPADGKPPEAPKAPVVVPPAAAPQPAKPTIQAKPKPKPPVYANGNPGAVGRKLKEMSVDELRQMSQLEYEKRRDAGEMN